MMPKAINSICRAMKTIDIIENEKKLQLSYVR